MVLIAKLCTVPNFKVLLVCTSDILYIKDKLVPTTEHISDTTVPVKKRWEQVIDTMFNLGHPKVTV